MPGQKGLSRRVGFYAPIEKIFKKRNLKNTIIITDRGFDVRSGTSPGDAHNKKILTSTGFVFARGQTDDGGCLAAAAAIKRRRKFRTPQGREVANGDRGRPQGQGHRKQTAPKGVRVKWRGKSPPAVRVTGRAWQPPPGARPNRFRFKDCPSFFLTERRNGLAARGRWQQRTQTNGRRPGQPG